MKSTTLLLLVLCLFTPALAQESWWRVLGEIKTGPFTGGSADEEVSKAVKKFLQQETFDEWEVYEDELVKLTYPKHPLLTFRKQEAEGGINVEGGVCTSVDNSFQTAYILEAGKSTYCVFLLNPAEWLDDGICMCGPMVHHVYNIENDCLVRFSLLPGGAVKKAQVLGGKLRLMAFEWTHLSCPKPVYERLVESMTLKVKHPQGGAFLKKQVIDTYGFEGRAGWLHPGTTLAEMSELMGDEPAKKKKRHTWSGRLGDYNAVLPVELKNGKMHRLLSEGPTATSNTPIKGSMSWVERAIRELTPDDQQTFFNGADDKLDPLGATAEQVMEALLELARKAPPSSDFFRACSAAEDLANLGTKDPRFLDILAQRDVRNASILNLQKVYGVKDLGPWLDKGLTALLPKDPMQVRESSMFGASYPLEKDYQSFLSERLKLDPKAGRKWATTFFDHPDGKWRASTVALAGELGPELAQRFATETLKEAIENEDGRLVWSIISLFNDDPFSGRPSSSDVEFGNPAEVLNLVQKIPGAEDQGSWGKSLRKTIKALETKVKTQAPQNALQPQ